MLNSIPESALANWKAHRHPGAVYVSGPDEDAP
jgi:hypothetical protein